jgi:hypothetical protein
MIPVSLIVQMQQVISQTWRWVGSSRPSTNASADAKSNTLLRLVDASIQINNDVDSCDQNFSRDENDDCQLWSVSASMCSEA